MRNAILTIAVLFLSAALSAQGVFANKTQAILEKVIQDYPNHFYNIKGELIDQAPRAAEYRSTLQLPGSSSCTVTFYTASGNAPERSEARETGEAQREVAEEPNATNVPERSEGNRGEARDDASTKVVGVARETSEARSKVASEAQRVQARNDAWRSSEQGTTFRRSSGSDAPTKFYSWTCTVLDADDFEQAKSRFRDIYGQISNSIIRSNAQNAQKTFILTGQYEEPEQNRRFTHVAFTLLPGVGDLKKLKVDLSLRQESKGWKIALSVNDQDGKEDAQVAMTGN